MSALCRQMAAATLLAAAIALFPPPAFAAGCDGVWVVVDAAAAGGSVTTRCAPGDPASGLHALTAVGHGYTFVPAVPGMVCTIDGRPDPCNNAPTDAYWSYWYAEPGGTWTYSQRGAGARNPSPGTVEGWAFGAGTPPSASPPQPKPDPKPDPKPQPDPKPDPKPDPTPPARSSPRSAPPPEPRATPGSATEGSSGGPERTENPTDADAPGDAAPAAGNASDATDEDTDATDAATPRPEPLVAGDPRLPAPARAAATGSRRPDAERSREDVEVAAAPVDDGSGLGGLVIGVVVIGAVVAGAALRHRTRRDDGG